MVETGPPLAVAELRAGQPVVPAVVRAEEVGLPAAFFEQRVELPVVDDVGREPVGVDARLLLRRSGQVDLPEDLLERLSQAIGDEPLPPGPDGVRRRPDGVPQPDALGTAGRLGRLGRRRHRPPLAVRLSVLPDQAPYEGPGDGMVAVVAAPLVVGPLAPGRHQRLDAGPLTRQRPPHRLGQVLDLPERVRETVLHRRRSRAGRRPVAAGEGDPHGRRVLDGDPYPVSAQLPLQ